MILEFCAENFTKVPQAIEKGAERIELCDNLAEGGTTASYGVIEKTVKYVNNHEKKVVVMIRPRGGNFVYSADEFEIMQKDLDYAKVLGAHGAAFGSLDENNRINRQQVSALLAQCDEMESVFHMAFDEIPREHQKEEIDWLIEQDVTRVLTHGGRQGTVYDNAEWLKELIEYADDKIEILIGGGVTHENYAELAEILPTNQFHGTKIVEL